MSRLAMIQDTSSGRCLNWLAGPIFVLLVVASTRTGSADSDTSALAGNHPLTQVQAGELLISELRCATCHGGVERTPLLAKTAPDLAEAGARISPEYLQRFLASPSSAHPGTTMPDVLASRPEAERVGIAEALTHFLISQSKLTVHANTALPANLP